jgi:hypothetical protein
MSQPDALFGPGETTREIMRGLREPQWTTNVPLVTCPQCKTEYPAGCVHHCPSYVPMPGVPPQSAPFPRLVTGAEVDALRAEVERLKARVAELEGMDTE